jgi:hypothetical protein
VPGGGFAFPGLPILLPVTICRVAASPYPAYESCGLQKLKPKAG